MGKRIQSAFYPDNSKTAKKYYRKILRLVLLAVLINFIVIVLHLHFLYKQEFKALYTKVDTYLFQQKNRIQKSEITDSTHFNFKHVPYMYSGHSYNIDSITRMFDRDMHAYYYAQTDTSAAHSVNPKVETSHYGIDVSQWQNSIDWVQVHNDTLPHKLKFFIIKATQGKSGVDPYFKYNWENAKTSSTMVGAYHFFIYKDDPKAQAENFIQNVHLEKGDILPIVDIELDCSGCIEPEVTKEELIRNLKIYIQIIEDHFNVKPIVYTYTYFFNEYLKGNFDDHLYWMAKFSTTPPEGIQIHGTDQNNLKPIIGIWQFANNERINGIVGNVDMSYVPVNYLNTLLYK